MSKNYFVYITTNPRRTTLYTGVTNDIVARLKEHHGSAISDQKSFAGKYHCYVLTYYEVFSDAMPAIQREKQIKGWRRQKKLSLIKLKNQGLRAMNEDVVVRYSSNSNRGFIV